MDDLPEVIKLQARIRQFAQERDWIKYHSAKNLAVAVASEAGELLSEFRWASANASDLTEEQLKAISFEIADVFIFLLRLVDVLEIDLVQATEQKLLLNEARFPKSET
jgi:dCTP diphosphatase